MNADAILHRFDHLGGQVFHFRGRRSCYVSVLPVGDIRVRYTRTCSSSWLLPDLCAVAERTAAREQAHANRELIARARSLPPVTPSLAMLEAYLLAIRVDTVAKNAWSYVDQWCRVVEICETRERAASIAALPALEAAFARAREVRS